MIIENFNLTDTEINELDNYINELVSNKGLNKHLLENATQEKLAKVDPSSIHSPIKYIRMVIKRLTEEKTDDLKKKRISVSTLHLNIAFEENKFIAPEEDKTLIELIEEHVINECSITTDQLSDLNHHVFDYCVKKDNKNTAFFIECLLKSKLLSKCYIPLEHLKEQAKKEVREWLELLQQLED